MKRERVLLFILCLLVGVSSAYARRITGVVTSDEDGETLIGASVYVSADEMKKLGIDQVVGVVTDIDGRYVIDVPEQITSLTFSYVGFDTKQVALTPGKNSYDVVLGSEGLELEGVVVTGYQTIERRKLTAAVSKFDISDAKIGAVKSIDQALSGQVAGLSALSTSGSPTAPIKIRIRGTSSLNGTQDPLWVLDGIPLEGTEIPDLEELKDIDNIQQTSIAGINPSDIDNITVLKDAAATAIYGARAANGVIVITTKKGKAGKTQVNFSTKLTYSPIVSIDRLNLLNSDEKVGLELDLLSSNYNFRANKGDVSRLINGAGELNAYMAGGFSALSPSLQSEINNLRSINTDWNDILFRGTFNQEYNVSVSGGNDKATYYTSIGYFDDMGNVSGVESNRLNIVLKTNYNINKYLKVGASLFANQRNNKSYLTDTNGFTNPVYYSRWANPYMRPYNDDGSYNYDVNVQGGKEDSSLDFNVFEERANTSNEQKVSALTSMFDAELRLNDELKFSTQLGIQMDYTSIERFADENSFAMRKDKERSMYTYPDGKKSFLPDGGMHKVNNNKSMQITWKALGEYRTTFGDIHEFETMLGTEIRKSTYQSQYTAAYGFDKRTLTSKPVIFPNENLAQSFPLHTKTFSENAFVSGFATTSYTLLKRYTFGGSIRFDGSDVYGVSKKYRYLPLYSVSGLWRMSNEAFLADVKQIDNMGLRLSYGLQGNIDKNTSPFVIGNIGNVTMLPGITEEVIGVAGAPNRLLRWEKTQSVNAGYDLGLFNGAINFSVDYYWRNSSDLIGIRMLPLETGFASTSVNWAQLRNEGVEVSLGTRNINTKNFTWYTNFNLGYNSNTVLRESVAENATYPSREGYPVGAIFAYKTAGLDDEGYPLFINKAGDKVSADELLKLNAAGASTLPASEQRDLLTYVGSTDPIISGGFTNTFDYKNFQLGVNMIFNLGMHVRTQPSYSPTNFDRGLNTNRDILNRWTPTNTNTSYPKLMDPTERPREYLQYSEFPLYSLLDTHVKKSNYVRVQSVRFGYRLPSEFLKKLRIASASLSLEGRNLFVFGSNYDNFLDPETMGNPFAQPIPKQFTFGLNVNF